MDYCRVLDKQVRGGKEIYLPFFRVWVQRLAGFFNLNRDGISCVSNTVLVVKID